jgi:phage terminase large subunit-like protein
MIMQRVVLDIPDSKINFFMELVNNLGIKKVKRLTKDQKEFIDDLKDSLSEVELHRQGKIKLQPARDFLNEL